VDKYLGKRLDRRYEIHELLGVGGMAMVYKAYDQINKTMVAIKILKDEFLANEDFIRRFKNESEAISVLSHNNIVKVNNVSFGDRIQYIVMEYIKGTTLKEYIQQKKRITWKEASNFVVQILKALEHAHKRGVIHRDIKPQNIMILPEGTIKVTDFGIARFTGQKSRTMTEKTIGSVHYISPEQARGEIADTKADIYSVGVMLYEMTAGKLPFEADTAVSVALMQVQDEPKPPRQICSTIPVGLEEITLKAMKKYKEQRYSSAEEMLGDIELVLNNPETILNYNYSSENNVVDNASTKYIDHLGNFAKSNLNKTKDYGDDYVVSDNKYDSTYKKKRDWMRIMSIVGIVAVVFSLGFATYAIVSHFSSVSAKDVEVPNFIGRKISEIKDDKKYKFNFETESVYDSERPEGVIIDQDPRPGSKKIKEDAKITLKVNGPAKQIKIPNVKGLSEEVAKSKLREAGLLCEVLTIEDSNSAEGLVAKTDPKEGSFADEKSVVKIFISKGASSKKIRVQNVVGLDRESAINRLVESGLKVSEKILTQNSDKPKDTVISISPSAGTEVSEGAAVQLTVSLGFAAEPPKKEKFLEIEVDLPKGVNKEVTISVYVDGVVDEENTKKVRPGYSDFYKFQVKGKAGKKIINVDLNESPYRVYEIDFDSNQVKKINSYDFSINPSHRNH
jgi:serine/threonine-protein kinase